MAKIWKPAVFQGKGKKNNYFEGWYFKLVSKDEKKAFAIIPGVSLTKDRAKSHAFVMVMDARQKQLYYFKFPLNQFWASYDEFEIRIGPNYFSTQKVCLNLNDGIKKINGQLNFQNIIPWPVKLLSPGVMGWYAFIPGMECYHGVLSFNHKIFGALTINGMEINFQDGKGYMEKDWGTSMPSSWIWMQTNHFQEDGVSLFGSVAKIPWLKNYFTGYIFGFMYGGHLYRFTTYNGAKIIELNVSNEKIKIKIEDKNYSLVIQASREEGVDLPAPSLGEMTAKVNESLNSRIKVELRGIKKNSDIIFSGVGRNAGLEFVGDVQELIKGFKDRSSF
jgi:hypothetical protein